MATLTNSTITQGDDNGVSLIDPVAELVSVDFGVESNEFVNGTARRVFFMLDNASAVDKWVGFRIQRSIGTASSARPIKDEYSDGYNPGNVILPEHVNAGELCLYGPFDPYFMNDANGEIKFTIWRNDAGTFKSDATAVADLTCASFYLPWYDLLTGDTTVEPGEAPVDPIAIPTSVSVQAITPHGLRQPTFTAHTSDNGWDCDLDSTYHDGSRYLAWVRNETGGAITLRWYAGLYWPPGGLTETHQWTSADIVGDPRPNISYFTIADGAGAMVGGFPKTCRYGGSYDLWMKDTASAVNANLDIAWLELVA